MKIIYKSLVCAFLAFVVVGCAGPTINVAKFSGEHYPAVAPNKVEVIAMGGLKRSFKEIGIFEVEEGPGSQTYDEMIQALRVRAGAMGAEAVVIQTSTKNQGAMYMGGMLMGISGKSIKAVGIRWTDR